MEQMLEMETVTNLLEHTARQLSSILRNQAIHKHPQQRSAKHATGSGHVLIDIPHSQLNMVPGHNQSAKLRLLMAHET